LYITETDSTKGWTGKTAKYKIRNSSFEKCVSFKGGAIMADNPESIQISDSSFVSNSAKTTNLFGNSGQGGALYFACNREFLDCEMDIEGTTFTNNFAFYEGGAVKWTMVEPSVSLTDRLFTSNYAGYYGDHIASYSQKIVKLSEEEYLAAQEKFTQGDEQSRRRLRE
jgi:hypothetical protein